MASASSVVAGRATPCQDGLKRRRAGRAGASAVGLGLLLVLASAGPVQAGGGAPDAGAPSQGPAAGSGGRVGPLPIVALGQRGQVSPPVIEDVEQMCALLTSCEGLPIPPNLVPADFATCVRLMDAELTAPGAIALSLMLRECGLSANSCNELKACALRGAKPESCVGRGKQTAAGFCDIDGRAMSCSHERVQAVRDCPRGGEQCAVRQGESFCTLGACPADLKEGAAPVCSASGTRILRCERGQLVSLDCTAFGLACGLTAAGPACVPQTPACAAGAKRCEGNVSVTCFSGHEVRVDCAAAGLDCAQSPGATPIGACFSPALPAGACDPTSSARCDGASIRYCNLGKPRSYLCKALGFSRCGGVGAGVRCF
jgi:hypothetical protein